MLRAILTALAIACEHTARAVIWGWERPRLRAPVWIAGLVLLVPLHAAPELLERFEGQSESARVIETKSLKCRIQPN